MAATAGCLPPPPPPPPSPPPPPPPPLGGFSGGVVGGFPEGGILSMLEGNGALECVLFVFVGGGEVVVMMGEMVGEVFNV